MLVFDVWKLNGLRKGCGCDGADWDWIGFGRGI